MPILISNCSDANSLAGAFTKVEKYAADNSFKIQKTKNDVSKMMAACVAQKPPDRPEVKFEDAGRTITATVGKAKKSVLVLGTKEQAAANVGSMLQNLGVMLKDASDKVDETLYGMFAKCTNYQQFTDMGQEGCNALIVVLKKMRADGTMGDKLTDFAKNPNVAAFGKKIAECGVKADGAVKEWDALAKQAEQFHGLLGQIEEKFRTVAVIMVKPEQVNEVNGALKAVASMKAGLMEMVNAGIPRGTAFMKLDANTTVADIESNVSMKFKETIQGLADRIAHGTETARKVREVHIGEAVKHLHALAKMT